MAAPKPVKLGPGTLNIGETGTAIDMSCLIQNATVAWDVDTEDDLNVLCGDTVPGARTYTATLSGTAVSDLTDPDGLVDFTWEHKGEAVPFVFVPNTDAGATVTGRCVLNPLDVGADDYGAVMTADFEWDCVGEPELDWATTESASATKTTTTKKTAAA